MAKQTTKTKYNIDNFDDLTRFANENFDTSGVDVSLFSSDESLQLTRLKSIILSLDQNITDGHLQELNDELADLALIWQDNKVADVYLQGLSKIGKYLCLRGAHAHPNAIKLLLTFFHRVETIASSPDSTDDRIATLLNNDLRKFKVLQHQIKLAEELGTTQEQEESAATDLSVAWRKKVVEDALHSCKAAILALDWELCDESLAEFAASLQAFNKAKIHDNAALILIKGLQALGQYIADERDRAHPEAFNLLHAFHDGLAQLLDESPFAPDVETEKRILMDRINRMNHLKKLIASSDTNASVTVPGSEFSALAAIDDVGPSGMADAELIQAPPQDTENIKQSSASRITTLDKTPADEAEIDPEIVNLLDSFLDDKALQPGQFDEETDNLPSLDHLVPTEQPLAGQLDIDTDLQDFLPSGHDSADIAEEELFFGEKSSQAVIGQVPTDGPSHNQTGHSNHANQQTAETLSASLAALGAVLAKLIRHYTPEHLANCKELLQSLRSQVQCTPAQQTATNMLETIITALPWHTGPENEAVVNSLFQVLQKPQEQLPLATVAAYTEWVRTLLLESLLVPEETASSKGHYSARSIHQELVAFRTRVEDELSQLRQEIRNK